MHYRRYNQALVSKNECDPYLPSFYPYSLYSAPLSDPSCDPAPSLPPPPAI
jgi:hypothetical protein